MNFSSTAGITDAARSDRLEKFQQGDTVKRTTLIACIAGGVVLILLWYFVLFSPTSKDLNDTRDQVATVEDQKQELQNTIRQLKELSANAPQQQASLRTLRAAIPANPDLGEFILQANDIAAASGIDWLSIAPTPPAPTTGAGPASTIAVSIQVDGGFFEVLDYLNRLEDLDRLVIVDSINVSVRRQRDRRRTRRPGVTSGTPDLSVTLDRAYVHGRRAPPADADGSTPEPPHRRPPLRAEARRRTRPPRPRPAPERAPDGRQRAEQPSTHRSCSPWAACCIALFAVVQPVERRRRLERRGERAAVDARAERRQRRAPAATATPSTTTPAAPSLPNGQFDVFATRNPFEPAIEVTDSGTGAPRHRTGRDRARRRRRRSTRRRPPTRPRPTPGEPGPVGGHDRRGDRRLRPGRRHDRPSCRSARRSTRSPRARCSRRATRSCRSPGTCGQFMYGDSPFSLCEGEQVIK